MIGLRAHGTQWLPAVLPAALVTTVLACQSEQAVSLDGPPSGFDGGASNSVDTIIAAPDGALRPIEFDAIRYVFTTGFDPRLDEAFAMFGRLSVILDAQTTYYVVGDCGWRDVYRGAPRPEAIEALGAWVAKLGRTEVQTSGCTQDAPVEMLTLYSKGEQVAHYAAELSFDYGETYCGVDEPVFTGLAEIVAQLTGLPVYEVGNDSKRSEALTALIATLPNIAPPAARLTVRVPAAPEPTNGEKVHPWSYGDVPIPTDETVQDKATVGRLWTFVREARATQPVDSNGCPLSPLVNAAGQPARVLLWPRFACCKGDDA